MRKAKHPYKKLFIRVPRTALKAKTRSKRPVFYVLDEEEMLMLMIRERRLSAKGK
jgi:hypothetical protein